MSTSTTIGAVVANAAGGAPDATAAIIGGTRHSFAELNDAGTTVARRLVEAGLKPGDIALVVSETSFDMLSTFVGCAHAGLVFAPINPHLGPSTIADTATRIGAARAFISPVLEASGTELKVPTAWFPVQNSTAVEAINAAGGAVGVGVGKPTPSSLGSTSPGSPTDDPLPVVLGSDPHIAFFTSGTTGTPKAAVISHQTSMLRSHPGSQLEPRGAALCPYPLFHMGGWTITLQQWHARAPVVFVDGTDAPTLVAALQNDEIERFNAIPALWTRLSEHLGDDAAGALPHLRFADTGTSPTSGELLASIEAMAPNAHVRVFYGSTEAGNVTSLHHKDLQRAVGSCGRASVLTTLDVSDEGELMISGPLLFDGYLNDPEATASALRNGWFRTGDRAEIDVDGFVRILGRLGTVIRSGGESIVPEAVEAAARTHPGVSDIAVFGMPDVQWGEIVWAAVVTDRPVGLADLRAHLDAASQPRHAHPRQLLALDTLPRTAATGQVDRQRLRQLAKDSQP